ncbi:HNH endonuclease [Arthrobacter phage Ryan]|uniref:HNH endonuclease n=1 Tax=Arthrobacter phage Ryan TaxID=2419968 RepID=A0A3G2KJI6_9CAUD|nr:HNH endonuclease [Arthrobacter phage Ryan]AYN59060.1 HNH endonuclease [Arthrobacter phage Ryan]
MTCKADGCTRGGRIRKGWCDPHYRRWLRHGDPNAGRDFAHRVFDFATRLMSRYEVDAATVCWTWTGTLTTGGYGQIARDGVASTVGA